MTATNDNGNARGGAARPAETRDRLIRAGLQLFGSHGFENVTTRTLAARAGVNQAAIPYHFGGKEGLYRAVCEAVVASIHESFGVLPRELDELFSTAPDPKTAAGRALRAVYAAFFTRTLERTDHKERMLFLMREYQNPGAGFDIIYEGALRAIHETMSRIAAAALGLEPGSEPAIIRGQVLLGQMFGFVPARHILFRRLSWSSYTPENVAGVVEAVTEMGLRALGLPPEDDEPMEVAS